MIFDDLNNALCYVNSVFKALSYSPNGTLVAREFVPVLHTALSVMSVESMRVGQPFLVRRGMLFAVLAQLATGAIALPLYYAIICYYGSRSRHNKPLPSEAAWTVLLSVPVLFLLPTWNVHATGWTYDALSLWQIYPVFLSLAYTVLPPLLKPILGRTRSPVPVSLIGLRGVALSAQQHVVVIDTLKRRQEGSLGAGLLQTFLPWQHDKSSDNDLVHEAHLFFTEDFLLCTLALLAFVIVRHGGDTLGQKSWAAIVWLSLAAPVGPGGSTSAIWASDVLHRPVRKVNSPSRGVSNTPAARDRPKKE